MAVSPNDAPPAPGWRGASGRVYPATAQAPDAFDMGSGHLFLIVGNDRALWVGTEADLIAEPKSRARFRAALRRATGVLRLEAPDTEGDRLALALDLEGGGPVAAQSAA